MKGITLRHGSKVSLLLMFLLSMVIVACGDNEAEAKPNDNGTTANVLTPNSTIQFGVYQQETARKDSISWVVLKVDGDKALLLSKYLLSARPWDETGENLTWDNSSIRKWLNGDFLNAAFSSEEQERILSTELDCTDQHGYGTPEGKNMTDKVFLLSVNEFDELVKTAGDTTAAPTQVAKDEGAYTNGEGNAAWWLRSPGMAADSPAYLSSAGELGTRAHKATEKILGIRPAIWVKITIR